MIRLLLLTAACVVGPASALLLAGPQTSERYSGDADFQVYCASCHGTAARGDGVLAGSLKRRPADLTAIAIKHGGAFPADAVFKTIDAGREHTEMPAWTQVFGKAQESASPEAAKERIEALVKYLRRIQREK